MTDNTSATGGYLVPVTGSAPIDGDDLDDLIQAFIVGVTGIEGTLVRPRWQVEPPTQPDISTNWIAFGVTKRISDTYSYQQHIPVDDGYEAVVRSEDLILLLSYYGPDAWNISEIFRSGSSVQQNRLELIANGISLIKVDDAINVPAYINNQWYRRVDAQVECRRLLYRLYPILTIESAGGELVTDEPPLTRDITVTLEES